MNPKGQQIEFEITPKENRANYSYLSDIKGDTREEASTVNVVFSHQSVIVIFICLIMSLIATFSLGVEKGKLIAKNITPPEKNFSAVQNLQRIEKTQELTTAIAGVDPSESNSTQINTQFLVKAQKIKNETVAATPPQTPIQAANEVKAQAPSVPTGGYTIQIASVKTRGSAEGLSENLTKKGIATFTKESGKFFIVLAGNYPKKEDAQANLKQLKKTFTDCFIKKI